MKKEYFNQEAYDYVASQINKTKIHSVFKPIVIDIILRRRYEYQLDDKYFHRDVESFINNVNEIYCKKLQKKDMAGCFLPKKKSIIINLKEFKKNMNEQDWEDLLEIIAHECEHALSDDETGNDRTFPREEIIINNTGKSFMTKGTREAFTEKKADRIVKNRDSEDASKYYKDTNGYRDITMFVDAIAAAFGIKEKDLLSAAIKGKKELYEILNSKIKDENLTKKRFEEIRLKIDIASAQVYKDDDRDNIDLKNFVYQYKFIYRDLEQILGDRIKRIEWDNPEELQEKLEDIKLSQNVIFNIMEGDIKAENRETVNKLAIPKKIMIFSKVMCMEEIIKNKGENSRELISFVQNSESVAGILEFMKQNGIEINSENLALMPEFELSNQTKDKWDKEFCLDGEKNNNKEMIEYMKEHQVEIENAKERVRFIDIIRRAKDIIYRVDDFIVNKILMAPFKFLGRVCKNLWKALPKKEKLLLLGERKTRKNRRQETMGVREWGIRSYPTSSS